MINIRISTRCGSSKIYCMGY